ncbi:hypothetical protein BhaS171_00067 [Bacillus phage vB_BhaS-171]|uniref:hypothetical protein n=1 Tax=Bacillus phage vB_BhaS-171 TaxID=1775140 RepID=UPI000744B1B9|nr:hypothetical protein BH781_gp58 [Bacillus phage vB_BhaS-171]YP_009273391.1 hypothetical protein BH781_gp67 [Bacillus phage vB_BhaS-171]ALY08114.1 hypothetical protein BhaS171_00058 [Bacillus phage vB_BhaS-171]ALY08123.1 hypothetical protein BhaS171_00067 [Bacillus phage vB_BhaS-171]
MNEEMTEFVDNLVMLWNKGELTEVAYRITSMYQGGDYRFISEAMEEFKKRITV